MKKLLLFSAALLLPALPLPAQQSPKVLLVAGNHLGVAVERAVQLKKAGIQVEVVIEREALLGLIQDSNIGDNPGWKAKMDAVAQEYEVENSTMTRGPLGTKTPKHPKFALLGRSYRRPPGSKPALKGLADAGIPYTVCSASAVRMYEVYDELKAAGLPMSPDKDFPVDLSPYVKQGYQIIVY